MPVPCKEVFDYVDGFDQDRLDATLEIIDQHLSNDDFRNQHRCGPRENPHYQLVLKGQRSEPELAAIKKLYLEAGWGEVTTEVIPEDAHYNPHNFTKTRVCLYRHSTTAVPAA